MHKERNNEGDQKPKECIQTHYFRWWNYQIQIENEHAYRVKRNRRGLTRSSSKHLKKKKDQAHLGKKKLM